VLQIYTQHTKTLSLGAAAVRNQIDAF